MRFYLFYFILFINLPLIGQDNKIITLKSFSGYFYTYKHNDNLITPVPQEKSDTPEKVLSTYISTTSRAKLKSIHVNPIKMSLIESLLTDNEIKRRKSWNGELNFAAVTRKVLMKDSKGDSLAVLTYKWYIDGKLKYNREITQILIKKKQSWEILSELRDKGKEDYYQLYFLFSKIKNEAWHQIFRGEDSFFNEKNYPNCIGQSGKGFNLNCFYAVFDEWYHKGRFTDEDIKKYMSEILE